jgi:hypothetical protein
MKAPHSNLIEAFLFNVEHGYIVGHESTSGPAVLTKLCEALGVILEGEDADVALEVERKRGSPSHDRNFILALIMRAQLNNGESVAFAEGSANDWLEDRGESYLSSRRLREIRNQYAKDIERLVSIQRMMEKTNGRPE